MRTAQPSAGPSRDGAAHRGQRAPVWIAAGGAVLLALAAGAHPLLEAVELGTAALGLALPEPSPVLACVGLFALLKLRSRSR